MVLILVLVVIALLSLAAAGFSRLTLTERRAAHLGGEQAQARALAESGVEMARMLLAYDEQTLYEAGGWYNNPGLQDVMVDDAGPHGSGRFTFVAPQVVEGSYSGVRYGLENESARLNLNMLIEMEKAAEAANSEAADMEPADSEAVEIEGGGRQMLMGLPGMTEDMADRILDYIDPDDELREYGAEAEEYMALDPPYSPKNGYLENVEELLNVSGMTPWLLFGVDANRNGYADTNEPDPASIPDVDNSDGSMDRGWAAYLTVSSLETNLRPDGQPRIDLNQSDMEALYLELEEALDSETAEFIVAYRQFGPYVEEEEEVEEDDPTDPDPKEPKSDPRGPPDDPPPQDPTPPSDPGTPTDPGTSEEPEPSDIETPNGLELSQPGKVQIENVLDLIGAVVRLGSEEGEEPEEEEEPTILGPAFPDDPDAMREYLPALMDSVTTDTREIIPGRINIDQAPRAVLAGIPGMTPELLEQIIFAQQPEPGGPESEHRHATWLLTEGLVSIEDMKKMMPFVTGGGSVFRGQVTGFFDQGGPTARIEVILDATEPPSPARVISWRDMGHLGRGYPSDILGSETPE